MTTKPERWTVHNPWNNLAATIDDDLKIYFRRVGEVDKLVLNLAHKESIAEHILYCDVEYDPDHIPDEAHYYRNGIVVFILDGIGEETVRQFQCRRCRGIVYFSGRHECIINDLWLNHREKVAQRYNLQEEAQMIKEIRKLRKELAQHESKTSEGRD